VHINKSCNTTFITFGFFMLYLIFETIKEFNHNVEEDYKLLESIKF